MARPIVLALACASAFILASAENRVVAEAGANPIRRIVTMLQGLAKKIKEEGDKEAKMISDYRCYCKTNTAEITASISNNEGKLPQLISGIQESQSKVTNLEAEVKTAEEDMAAAQAAVESATKQRAAENKVFVEESEQYKEMINTLKRAIPALEKGLAGSFLQESGMQASLQVALEGTMQLNEYQKQDVVSFLSGRTTLSAPASQEIAGILKTMKDEAEKNLADAESAEDGQVKSNDELVAAKTKQIKTLKEPMQEKTERKAELALSAAKMKKDLAETRAALTADQKFASDLATSCSEKEAMVEKNAEARSEESVALSDTINILNEDSALETFKKTLPSASFLQMDTSLKRQGTQALNKLRSFRSSGQHSEWAKSDLDLLELALKGGKADFSKVTKMIDEMVKGFKDQQVLDDKKLETCKKQIAASEAKLKTSSQKITYLGATADEREEILSAAKAEVKALAASIKQLDSAVKGATTQRQGENAEYKELMSSNQAAVDLLNLAKARMSEFYNPTEHPKTGFIVMPGWKGPASFAQISMHSQLSSQVSSQVYTEYKKEVSNKVISMLEHLIKDLNKEVTKAEAEEKYAQQDYENMLKDSEDRRAESARSLVEKESVMADAEDSILETKQSLKTETAQRADAEKFDRTLRSDCKWLMDNFEDRKEARKNEAAALRDTKATLAGADLSFLQTASLRGAGIVVANVNARRVDLHDSMRAMMADDDDEDLSDPQRSSLLQSNTDSDSKAYLEESANSLSSALGDRWDGQKLEEDAKSKTNALLQGIAGHKALGGLNAMLGAVSAMR